MDNFEQKEELDNKIGEEEAQANYAMQLNNLRFLENTAQEIERIHQAGQSFGKPSFSKYFVVGTLALTKDAIDILALVGIVTIPLAWFIGPFITCLVILIFWLFDVKIKRAKEFMSGLEKDIEVIQENIAHVARIVNRVPGARRIIARSSTKLLARAAIKIENKLAGSPLAKQIIGGIIDNFANLTVILQWLPGSTIAVVLSYLDERKVYQNAAENASKAHIQLSSHLAETASNI